MEEVWTLWQKERLQSRHAMQYCCWLFLLTRRRFVFCYGRRVLEAAIDILRHGRPDDNVNKQVKLKVRWRPSLLALKTGAMSTNFGTLTGS